MATRRGQREERRREAEANAATAAVAPTEYERYQKPKDLSLIRDLDSGKDVRDIDGLRWSYNLFQNARQDPDLSGVGLLGSNTLSGANANTLGVVREQVKARERQDREGQLYDSVQDARSGALNRSQGFSDVEENRNRFRADQANQRYTAYLNRPRQPSILGQILGGAAQVGAAYVGSGGA